MYDVPSTVKERPAWLGCTVTEIVPEVTVKKPDALVAVWPSGFVTVMVLAPIVAPAAIVALIVIVVGLEKVTLLTVTPPPFTTAVRRLGNPVPGSKKPEPEIVVPDSVTFTFACPCCTLAGEHEMGVAGGGACSRATQVPQMFAVLLAYSWIVQRLMSSLGSRLV